MSTPMRRAFFRAKAATVRAKAGSFHRELLANERLSPDEFAQMQNGLARDIAAFAMKSSPFYGRHYGELGIRPNSLIDPEAWAALPILDRATVKQHAAEFRTAEATDANARPALTGGSTGEPLATFHDARVPSLALSWRMYSWWGVEPSDDLARVGRWNFGRLATLKNDVAWWPTKQVYLDAGLISAQTMETFHRQLTATRPRLIEGYVGAMLEFADFLERRKLTVPAPTAIATTAAPLTASVRARLESVFGAPVYDEYRGSEFGWIAGECGHRDGLHVFADVRRVEVVDEDGAPAAPGQLGDLVITDLRNRVFPMIRYRTGDKGILREEPCRCGRALPLMEQPQGRTTDLIRLPSGTVLAHRLMGMFAAHPEAVRLFQIHQLSDYSIIIRVVVGDGAQARDQIESAVTSLRERIANEVPVTVEYVDALPYTGGKTKYVISDVPTTT
ncbi:MULTISPECIES: phenylacetate--CoA ligase family protein [unclassified Microbacterium]|uniref:phenylacetate--CoA ligase family protein n=1 Tax=unclassified Microbacterium TaxID=2609290 RepID=UPI00109D3AF3|nr:MULTISPECIES: phenylacetate--CoA ligase family protein [unclassified Microbacterium]